MEIRSSIFIAAFLVLSTLAEAQSLQDSQRKKDALERDIAVLQSQLSKTSSRSEQAISSLNIIQAQKASIQKLVSQSDAAIASYDERINATQREIKRQQAALDTLKIHYSRLVMGAYKNRDVKIWYMYILASENVSQAFRRFSYFKNLSAQLDVQARKIEQFKTELKLKNAGLRELKNAAQKERDGRASELARLKANEKEQTALVARLKKNRKSYQASLQAKQKEMRALDSQINRMLQESSRKKSSKVKTDNVADMALAMSFEKNRGRLPWPVDGPVTEHFGAYQNRELKLSLFNNGINIACDPGTKVTAVFEGTVSNIMLAPGYGQCILIRHGNYYTSYCKIRNALVRQGDKVVTGQVIGEVATIMGKTQLYFLIYNRKYVDPERWLRPR